MEFWNSLLTEKSWNILVELNKKPFKFIVIGGWAAYLWTRLHKSKDLDIALTDLKQLEYLKENYNLKKNDNLKKYEISFEEIDVDIYAPFFSKLAIPVEDIKSYSTKVENFNVVIPEVLLILKQGAEIDREKSVKGGKDRIDIMTLLCFTDVNFKKYFELLKKYKIEHFKYRLIEIIRNFKDMQYLELNPRQLKLKKSKILDELKRN
ncbi:hypothetical protein HYU07_00615 [Candidatus Woesearchaeota archaeon]|nr:hypothetical protein [Candidatus Woesearchaeota archaeon]